VQAAPAAAPSVFPDSPFAAPPQSAPAAPANDADALPPPDPITGPVPLPRHRPNVIALVDADIPLPRARPSDAPEPPTTAPDAPPSGYDPGIGHEGRTAGPGAPTAATTRSRRSSEIGPPHRNAGRHSS